MGHSTSSGRSTGGASRRPQSLRDDDQVMRGARDLVRYNMPSGFESATVDDVVDLGNGNARIEYHGSVRITYGRDPETGREEYGYEDEYSEREVSIDELRRRARR